MVVAVVVVVVVVVVNKGLEDLYLAFAIVCELKALSIILKSQVNWCHRLFLKR